MPWLVSILRSVETYYSVDIPIPGPGLRVSTTRTRKRKPWIRRFARVLELASWQHSLGKSSPTSIEAVLSVVNLWIGSVMPRFGDKETQMRHVEAFFLQALVLSKSYGFFTNPAHKCQRILFTLSSKTINRCIVLPKSRSIHISHLLDVSLNPYSSNTPLKY